MYTYVWDTTTAAVAAVVVVVVVVVVVAAAPRLGSGAIEQDNVLCPRRPAMPR